MYPFSLPTNSSPRQVADTLARFGLAHIAGFLQGEQLRRLTHETEDVLAQPPTWSYPEAYSLGTAVRMVRKEIDENRYPTILEVFGDPYLEEVISHHYGEGYVFSEQIYAIRDVVGSETIVQQMHYDKVQHVKCFFYLSDVGPGNGPFHCVPESQHLASSAQAENRRLGVIPTDDDARVLPEPLQDEELAVLGPAGTLIVFNSDLAHRAGVPTTGPRLAIRSLNFGRDSLGQRV
jgi:hypothetical protein